MELEISIFGVWDFEFEVLNLRFAILEFEISSLRIWVRVLSLMFGVWKFRVWDFGFGSLCLGFGVWFLLFEILEFEILSLWFWGLEFGFFWLRFRV